MVSLLSYSIVGQLFYVLTQLGVLSAIAHLRGAQAVGEFALALAITSPIFMLSNFGLRTLQAADVEQRYSFKEYAGFRFITSSLALLASLAIAVLISKTSSILAIMAVIALTKSAESISELAYGTFQRLERTDLVAFSLVLRGVLTLLIFVGLLLIGAPTPVAFTAQLLVWLFVALALDYPKASQLSSGRLIAPMVTADRARLLLRRAAPLGGSSLAMALQTSLPRLIVDHYLGLATLGIFTSISYLLQAGALAANAVGFALTARFAKLSTGRNDIVLSRLVSGLILVAVTVGALGLAITYHYGSLILRVLFGSTFSNHVDLLMFVATALALRIVTTVPTSLYLAKGKNENVFWREAALVVVTLGASLALIPSLQLLGAGYVLLTIAGSRAAIVVGEYVAVRRRQR